MQKIEKKLASIDEVLIKASNQRQKLISEIETEERVLDSIETEESIKNEILADTLNSLNKKNKLIYEIKNGLGDEIKQNKGVRIIKKSLSKRIINFIKNIFTKF